MTTAHPHSEIIVTLGGYVAVAEALDCHKSRPHRWMEDGIPVKRWGSLLRMAEQKGVRLSVDDLARAHIGQEA